LMINIKSTFCTTIILFVLATNTIAANLPPEILADKYILEAKKRVIEKEFSAAEKSFEKIEKLNIKVPDAFFFHYGKILSKTGKAIKSVDYLVKYLQISGNKGQFYHQTLELLIEMEPQAEREARDFSKHLARQKDRLIIQQRYADELIYWKKQEKQRKEREALKEKEKEKEEKEKKEAVNPILKAN